jgi:hypothetical protein
VIELAEGWSGFLIVNERFFLVLDGLIIYLGVLGLSLVHPGFALGRDVIPVKGLHFRNVKSSLASTSSSEMASREEGKGEDV